MSSAPLLAPHKDTDIRDVLNVGGGEQPAGGQRQVEAADEDEFQQQQQLLQQTLVVMSSLKLEASVRDAAMEEVRREYDRLLQENKGMASTSAQPPHTASISILKANNKEGKGLMRHDNNDIMDTNPIVLGLQERTRQLEEQYDQDISSLQQAMKRMELERQTALEALEQHGITIATTISSMSSTDNLVASSSAATSTGRRQHPWDRGGRRHHALTQAEQQFRTAMAKLHAMDEKRGEDDGGDQVKQQPTTTTDSNSAPSVQVTTTLPFIPVAALHFPTSTAKPILRSKPWKYQFRSAMSELHAQEDQDEEEKTGQHQPQDQDQQDMPQKPLQAKELVQQKPHQHEQQLQHQQPQQPSHPENVTDNIPPPASAAVGTQLVDSGKQGAPNPRQEQAPQRQLVQDEGVTITEAPPPISSDQKMVHLDKAVDKPAELSSITSSQPATVSLGEWKGQFRSAMDQLHAREKDDETDTHTPPSANKAYSGVYAALAALQTVNQSLLEQNALLASELREERDSSSMEDERLLNQAWNERDQAIHARDQAERKIVDMVEKLKMVRDAVAQQEDEVEQLHAELQQALEDKRQLETTVAKMLKKSQQPQVQQTLASVPKDAAGKQKESPIDDDGLVSRPQPQNAEAEFKESLLSEQKEKAAPLAEKETLKSTLDEREELVSASSAMIKQLQDDLSRVQSERVAALRCKDELQSTNKQLEGRISELEDTVVSLDRQYKLALQESQLPENRRSQTEGRLEAVLGTKDALEIPHSEPAANTVNSAISRERHAELEEEIKALKEERDRLEDMLNQKSLTGSNGGAGLGSVEMQALAATLERLQRELRETNDEKARLEELDDALQRNTRDLEDNASAEVRKLSSEAPPQEHISRSIPQIGSGGMANESERVMLQKKLAATTTENIALSQRVMHLQNRIDETMVTQNAVENSLNAAMATVDAIRETLAIVQASAYARCERLLKEKEKAYKKIGQLEASAAESHDLMRTATSIMRSMKADVGITRSLQKELKDAINAKFVLEQKLEHANAQLKNLERARAATTHDLAIYSTEPSRGDNQLIAHNVEKTTALVTPTEEAGGALTAKLQNELMEAIGARDSLVKKLEQLEAQLKEQGQLRARQASLNEAKTKQNTALFEAITARDALAEKLEQAESKLKQHRQLAESTFEKHETKAKEKDALIQELRSRLAAHKPNGAQLSSNKPDGAQVPSNSPDGSTNVVDAGNVESLMNEKRKLTEKMQYMESLLRDRDTRINKMEVQLVLLRANQGMGEASPTEKQALGPMLKDLERAVTDRDFRIVLLEDQLALANLNFKRSTLHASLLEERANATVAPIGGSPRRAMSGQTPRRAVNPTVMTRGLSLARSLASDSSKRSVVVQEETEQSTPASEPSGTTPKRTRSKTLSVRKTLSGGFGWKKKTDGEQRKVL